MSALFPSSGNNLLNCGSAADIDNLFAGAGDTVMGWIYLNGYGGSSTGIIMDKSNADGDLGWTVSVDDESDRLVFVQERDTFFQGRWLSPVNSILLNTWYHWAIKYDRDADANDPTIYIDGQSVTVTETEEPFGAQNSDAAERLTIGGRPSGGRSFDGRISDTRIYSGLMPDNRVQHIFAMHGRDRIVENLLRRWPLVGRSGLGFYTPYRDHTRQSNANTASITVTVPVHVESQDTLIMIVAWGSDTGGTPANITTPSGWTQRLHLDLPATASTPIVAVYTRAPSSEPASYVVSANQTAPNMAFMISYKIGTGVHLNMATATGTSASPSSPTATPGENALALRIVCVDSDTNLPTEEADIFPTDFGHRRDQIAASGGGSNGCVLAFGEEMFDGAAVGAETWKPVASDQWAGATATYAAGSGIEGLPVKELANREHGEIWGKVGGAGDIIRAL